MREAELLGGSWQATGKLPRK